MTREQLQQLIEAQLAEMVAQKVWEKLVALQKKALVVYTGSTMGFAQSLESLKKLRQEGFTYQVFLSRSAGALLDVNAIREALQPENLWIGTTEQPPEALAAACPTVLVPALTINTASHIAGCMPDSPASRIITNAMWRGKNVVVSIDGCCPDNPLRAAKGYRMTEALKAHLRENLAAMESFGATLTSGEGLYRKTLKVIGAPAAPAPAPRSDQAVKPAPTAPSVRTSGKVIGNAQVLTCPAGGVLRVPKGSLVTQMARDTAAVRGVTIVQE